MSNILISKIEKRENPFLMMDKKPLFDPSYDWATKGVLATLLALKTGGEINLTRLNNFSKNGEHATKTALKRLKELGHLKVINEAGRWFCEVYETPLETPVLSFERRTKPLSNLAVILKNNGLSEEQIAKIIKETEQETTTTLEPLPPVEKSETVIGGFVAQMKNDRIFISKTISDYNLTDIVLSELLNDFVNRPAQLGTPNTASYAEFTKHFYNWIPKQDRAKRERAKMKKSQPNAVQLPTHEEIKAEIKNCISMIYASTEFGFSYLQETIKTSIFWIEKAEKLKISLDSETFKKATFILTLDNEEIKQRQFFEFLAAKKHTDSEKTQQLSNENIAHNGISSDINGIADDKAINGNTSKKQAITANSPVNSSQ